MPPKKQKKPPNNAFYFYMVARKRELEAQGYRFPGGMKDVATSLASEWKNVSKEAKAPFEEEARIAKLDGKTDLDNKFTVTGESYAQVNTRTMEERQAKEDQDNCISELATGEGALDRIFILIKTTHCVEQIAQKNRRIYWPLELGMAAFNLRGGLQSTYWTLIDTETTPVGYASAAKETSEETCLPEPGSQLFSPDHRDYTKIMKNVKGFVEHWLKKGYPRGPVIFAMDQETPHIRGCLDWLVDHMNADKQNEFDQFLDHLKLYPLQKLILRFADYAHQLDPAYRNVMTDYKLDNTAASIVSKGCFDYRDEITCVFHKTEAASLKMPTCCRNIVLRRMFLMFEEFIPAFGLEMLDRHDINKLARPPQQKPRTSSTTTRTVSKDEEDKPGTSLSAPVTATDNWGRPIKAPEEPKQFNSQRRRDDPPSPSMMANHDDSEGFVPWGRARPAPTASFSSDDFPELGAIPSRSNIGQGMGRGRGRGAMRPEEDDEPNAPAAAYY